MDAADELKALCRNLRAHSAQARSRLALSAEASDRLAKQHVGTVEAIELGKNSPATIWDLQRLSLTLGLTRHGLPKDLDPFVEDDLC